MLSFGGNTPSEDTSGAFNFVLSSCGSRSINMLMLAIMTIAGFTSFEPRFRFPAISLTYTHVKAHILVVCMLINMDSARTSRYVVYFIFCCSF